MFDCKQDIGLLHDSLLSAAYPNSAALFGCANIKDAVHNIYDSVRMIIHHILSGIEDEKEKVKVRIHCNERLHTAIFFTTLRSHDIKSKSADEFYGSIVYNWPSMDLKFYVELSLKCDWSEYFIMCALQLPSEVLLEILRIVLDIQFSSDVKYYSWHLLLQILIFKLLKVPYGNEVKYPFDFDFTSAVNESEDNPFQKSDKMIENFNNNDDRHTDINERIITDKEYCEISDIINTIIENVNVAEKKSGDLTQMSCKMSEINDDVPEKENEDLTYFKTMYNDLCDLIGMKMNESNEIDLIKTLLHALRTFSKCLITRSKEYDINALQFHDFDRICELIECYMESAANQEKLKIELEKCSNIFFSHVYASTSWKISLNYLIFLVGFYVSDEINNVYSNMSLVKDDRVYCKMISIVNTLGCLNCTSLKSDENLVLLGKIIQFEFPGSSCAAKMFLADSDIFEKDFILTVLEENCHVINFPLSYSIMIDNIMAAKSQKSKLRLLKILYKCLHENGLNMYNMVLDYILTNYGITEEFQLPDFKKQLSEFARQTPTLEEVEKTFPALLVQNPITAVKYIIDETLTQGSSGKVFIQILKYFKNVCSYIKNNSHLCILHEILHDYFNKKELETYESKNIVMLYRFLMEIHLEIPILQPCTFFKMCIVPKLYPEFDKIELLLECAHILVPALLSDDSFLKDSESLVCFITEFGVLANHFIVTGNGKMKSLVTSVLKEFENYQMSSKQVKDEEKLKLWLTFKNLNEMVCAYVKEFLPGDIEFISKSFVWTWCCKNEDSTNFYETFSVETLTFTLLVNTLVEVLPHLTQKEWLYSFHLAAICCNNCQLKDEIVSSNNLFQLTGSQLNTYAVILSIITSLHFILNDNIDGSLHLSSCFSNCLKINLCQEEAAHTHMLLSIALELCHLISRIAPEIVHIFSAILLELKKAILASCSVESDRNDCNMLLSNAVNCLPDSYQAIISL